GGDETALRPARERRFRARTPGDGRRLVIRRRRGLRHRSRDRRSDDGGQNGQREATHFSPTPPMWTESEIAIRVPPGQPPRRAVLGHNGCLPWEGSRARLAVVDLLPGVRSSLVDTGRIRMRVLEAGPTDGEPVVLVHGNLST